LHGKVLPKVTETSFFVDYSFKTPDITILRWGKRSIEAFTKCPRFRNRLTSGEKPTIRIFPARNLHAEDET
jgi:hypothetical protein